MTVTGYRLYKARHESTAFTGEGARLYGGRWNSPGVAVVYVSQSVALATLELLVNSDPALLASGYRVCAVQFDERLLTEIDAKTLPPRWRDSPPVQATRDLGDNWARSGTSVALRVPSAVVPTEFNYLLNPAHADWSRVHIQAPADFLLDRRLVK